MHVAGLLVVALACLVGGVFCLCDAAAGWVFGHDNKVGVAVAALLFVGMLVAVFAAGWRARGTP